MEHNGNWEKTSQVYIVTIIYSYRLQWPEIRKSSILGVQRACLLRALMCQAVL